MDPNWSNASREWLHWHKTFENFLESLLEEKLEKLNVLISFASPHLYETTSFLFVFNVQWCQASSSRFLIRQNEWSLREVSSVLVEAASIEQYLQKFMSWKILPICCCLGHNIPQWGYTWFACQRPFFTVNQTTPPGKYFVGLKDDRNSSLCFSPDSM